MNKLIFTFKDEKEMQNWLDYYQDGGGLEEMVNVFNHNDDEYPDIKITKE